MTVGQFYPFGGRGKGRGLTFCENALCPLRRRAKPVKEAHPITLSDSEPEPDIAIAESRRLCLIVPTSATRYKTHHPYPEDIYWLIEIGYSSFSKDLGLKKRLYANAKIKEYWVIDILEKNLKVFQNPSGDDYKIEQEYKNGVVFSLAFPSLEIMVEKLIGLESNSS